MDLSHGNTSAFNSETTIAAERFVIESHLTYKIPSRIDINYYIFLMTLFFYFPLFFNTTEEMKKKREKMYE